jgi:Zn-dependent protease with chaperone function
MGETEMAASINRVETGGSAQPTTTIGVSEYVPDIEIPPARIPLFYQFGLLLVAGAMVLLPGIYLASIGLVAYGVYYYATHVDPGSNATGTQYFFGYLAPIFFGSAFCLTLFKTFLARRPKPPAPCIISRQDAPEFFELLERLCRTLKAPMPDKVLVDCRINASAGYGSLFGRDLRLTVGLPLAAGLDLREFTGVLAHELGHLSQKTAMRLNFVINWTNGWFARAVYERDIWDYRLALFTRMSPGIIKVFLLTGQLGIWLSRRVLWVLMVAGRGISCFMMRQMEYDADRCEIKIAGTDSFVLTVQRLSDLNLAFERTMMHMKKTWKQHRQLYDRLPELLLTRAREISSNASEKALNEALQKKTRLFDSHPAPNKRIARAKKANEPGILAPQSRPAASLFPQFDRLSREATTNQYRIWLGPAFQPHDLVALEDNVEQTAHDAGADPEAIKRYFMGVEDEWRWLILSPDKVLTNFAEDSAREGITKAKQQMAAAQAKAAENMKVFKQADATMLSAWQAIQLSLAGLPYEHVGLEPKPDGTRYSFQDVEKVLAVSTQSRQTSSFQLEAFERLIAERLTIGLQLIRLPRLVASFPEAARMRSQAYERLAVLALYKDIATPLAELRKDGGALRVLLESPASQPRSEETNATLTKLNTRMIANLNRVQATVAKVKYPFPYRRGVISLGEYIQFKGKPENALQRTLEDSSYKLAQLVTLHRRILASLIEVAEWVEEKAAGN